MDYELMMNSNVKIGQEAPDFKADTTLGKIGLNDYKDKWLVLFSYTGDFAPVSTTEIIAFQKAYSYFENMNTRLLGLSTDRNEVHLAWLNDIKIKTGVSVLFPLISDGNGEIARKYGMISNDISNIYPIRNTYIIDKNRKIRLILTYPINIR